MPPSCPCRLVGLPMPRRPVCADRSKRHTAPMRKSWHALMHTAAGEDLPFQSQPCGINRSRSTHDHAAELQSHDPAIHVPHSEYERSTTGAAVAPATEWGDGSPARLALGHGGHVSRPAAACGAQLIAPSLGGLAGLSAHGHGRGGHHSGCGETGSNNIGAASGDHDAHAPPHTPPSNATTLWAKRRATDESPGSRPDNLQLVSLRCATTIRQARAACNRLLPPLRCVA